MRHSCPAASRPCPGALKGSSGGAEAPVDCSAVGEGAEVCGAPPGAAWRADIPSGGCGHIQLYTLAGSDGTCFSMPSHSLGGGSRRVCSRERLCRLPVIEWSSRNGSGRKEVCCRGLRGHGRSSDRSSSRPLPNVAYPCHNYGMTRTRLSTTVDRDLLDGARKAHGGTTDAELIDEALAALLLRYRAAEVDDAYEVAYRDHPIDEPDEWGDLASFRDAAAAT